MSSLPSLHAEIKSAVTASEKNWLLDMREVSAQVGRLALNQMEVRMRKWKSKQDRDPGLRHIRVGDPIELASNDKTECKSSKIVPVPARSLSDHHRTSHSRSTQQRSGASGFTAFVTVHPYLQCS